MDSKQVVVWFLTACVMLLLLPCPAAADESPPNIACTTTRHDNGSVTCRVSRSSSSSQCTTTWEDKNKIQLAHQSSMDENRLWSKGRNFITLKECQDGVRFILDCLNSSEVEDATCNMTCPQSDVNQDPMPANSTLTCVFSSCCPEPRTLVIGSVVLLAVVAAAACGFHHLWKRFTCRRGQSAARSTQYTAAPGEVKVMKN